MQKMKQIAIVLTISELVMMVNVYPVIIYAMGRLNWVMLIMVLTVVMGLMKV